MTTALFVISLFFLVLSTISVIAAFLCCGAALNVLRELQAMELSCREFRQGSLSETLIPDRWKQRYGMKKKHQVPQGDDFTEWLKRYGINN